MRQFLEVSGKKFNPWAKKLLKYIGSGLEEADLKELHWMQVVLYYQNFELQCTVKAQEVIVQAFLDSTKPEKVSAYRLLLQILVLGTGNQGSFNGLEEGW